MGSYESARDDMERKRTVRRSTSISSCVKLVKTVADHRLSLMMHLNPVALRELAPHPRSF